MWTIARPPAAGGDDHGELLVPGGWSGLLPRNSIVIASARPLNEVHLRADVILPGESEAEKFAAQVNTYLAVFKSLEISMDTGGPDKDVKAAFDSLEVHQDKNEAVLTAKVPYAFFKKVMVEPPATLAHPANSALSVTTPARDAKATLRSRESRTSRDHHEEVETPTGTDLSSRKSRDPHLNRFVITKSRDPHLNRICLITRKIETSHSTDLSSPGGLQADRDLLFERFEDCVPV